MSILIKKVCEILRDFIFSLQSFLLFSHFDFKNSLTFCTVSENFNKTLNVLLKFYKELQYQIQLSFCSFTKISLPQKQKPSGFYWANHHQKQQSPKAKRTKTREVSSLSDKHKKPLL